jgi:hypothetical protein
MDLMKIHKYVLLTLNGFVLKVGKLPCDRCTKITPMVTTHCQRIEIIVNIIRAEKLGLEIHKNWKRGVRWRGVE